MAQITGGRVVYSRTIQPVQYESKHATCELVFTLEVGESLKDALAELQQVAKQEVLTTLGLNKKGAK